MSRAHDPTDADLRDPVLERLGEGADPSPARRQALVGRITAGGVGARRPARRRLRGWWIGAAAAAAVVAAVLLRPAEPEPIPPTALLGDLLGPLPTLSDAGPGPAEENDSASPATDALMVVWEDLKGPLSIVAQAANGRRALLDDEPIGPAPAGGSDVTKED